MAYCNVIKWDPMFGLASFPVGASIATYPITVGDFVKWDASAGIILACQVGDNETFAGISLGASALVGDSPLLIATECEFYCTATSGSFRYGLTAKIASSTGATVSSKTLVVDSSADTVAWFVRDVSNNVPLTATTLAEGIFYTNIILLGATAENLVEAVSN